MHQIDGFVTIQITPRGEIWLVPLADMARSLGIIRCSEDQARWLSSALIVAANCAMDIRPPSRDEPSTAGAHDAGQD